MPHEIHEAPLTYLVQRLSSVFQEIPFGKTSGALNIQTLSNTTIHGDTIDSVPDIVVRMDYTPSTPHLVASHYCLAVECAFTQSNADVMRKLKTYIANFPDLIAVSKIVIKETPYTTPNDHSRITRHYQTTSIPSIVRQDWMSRKKKCNAMGPVTHEGFTFINITAIDMYVWVRTAKDPINVAELNTSTQVFAQGVSTPLV